jgi:hypothetical protein
VFSGTPVLNLCNRRRFIPLHWRRAAPVNGGLPSRQGPFIRRRLLHGSGAFRTIKDPTSASSSRTGSCFRPTSTRGMFEEMAQVRAASPCCKSSRLVESDSSITHWSWRSFMKRATTGRLKTLAQILLVAFFAGSASDAAENSARPDSPNIILILTDDQGWSQRSELMDPRVPESVSAYLETPNMNRLAREGMRFTSGYSPAPLCTPTRRSILCGAATARCGSEFKSDWVPADHMTIPKALKSVNRDYRCAHFGKWGEQMISTPEQCGYDTSDGLTGNNTGGMPQSSVRRGTRTDRRTTSTMTIRSARGR